MGLPESQRGLGEARSGFQTNGLLLPLSGLGQAVICLRASLGTYPAKKKICSRKK